MILNSSGLPINQPQPIITEWWASPNAQNRHPQFIEFCKKVKKSLRVGMFHWTDLEALEVLVWLKNNGRDVRLILDRTSILNDKGGRYKPALDIIKKNKIQWRMSCKAFSISHWKAAFADVETDSPNTLISTENLTEEANVTVDFGIITPDQAINKECVMVFDHDWTNSESESLDDSLDASLTNPFLVWSPNNSSSKLIALANLADQSLDFFVENLGYQDLQAAMIEAHQKRNAQVRGITPLWDKNPSNPNFDVPFVKALEAAGCDAKVMPGKNGSKEASADFPYIHGKLICVNKSWLYLGSINFSFNSIRKARELGIIFQNAEIATAVTKIFDGYYAKAITPPDDLPQHKRDDVAPQQ